MVLVALVFVPPALASSVFVDGTTLIIDAEPGETNTIGIGYFDETFIVSEDTAPLTVGPGCWLERAGLARCGGADVTDVSITTEDLDDSVDHHGGERGTHDFVIDGGAGNDELYGDIPSSRGNVISGGEGDDVIVGSPGYDDAIDAGAGDDVVTGAVEPEATVGRDVVDGGPGDDVFYPGVGPDWIRGGDGVDRVEYWRDPAFWRSPDAQFTITLDGIADDGVPFEGDNIGSDVEDVVGSYGPDHIVGTAGKNEISGLLGDDLIDGLAGDDDLTAGRDADDLRGGEGDDVLRDGDDDETGTPGADLFAGGDGWDVVSFEGRLSDVTIALDDVANDGRSDEHDDVRSDVEEAVGGRGNDLLVGTDEANVLDGAAGDDILVGLLGADDLFGGGGFDLVSYSDRDDAVTATLDGVAGDGTDGEDDWVGPDVEDLEGGNGGDRLVGDAGENFLFGGAGNDQLDPLEGADYVSGEGGDDILALRDGFDDEADCGTENDVVTADSGDTAAVDCEVVNRPAAPPPPAPAPPAPQPPAPPPPPPPPAHQPQPRPPAQARCAVPNVKRKTVGQARRLLAARRCRLGKVIRAYSGKVPAGRIISQSRRPGVRLTRGTKVNVLVSRGKKK
jgi:Ca2+-binding RTX toxin-like protein